MSTTENNDVRPVSRYEIGDDWDRKRRFWSRWVYLISGVLIGNFLSSVAFDLALPWQVTFALVGVEVGVIVRMIACFRRALRAWRGGAA